MPRERPERPSYPALAALLGSRGLSDWDAVTWTRERLRAMDPDKGSVGSLNVEQWEELWALAGEASAEEQHAPERKGRDVQP